MHSLSIQYLLVACIGISLGHVEMSYPPPRGSKHNTMYQPVDYNLNAPLSSLVHIWSSTEPIIYCIFFYQQMCGGKPAGPVVATYNAGQYVPVKFEGSARHGGVISRSSSLIFANYL